MTRSCTGGATSSEAPVHNRTDRRLWNGHDRDTPRKDLLRRAPMPFTVGFIIVSVAAVIIHRMRPPAGANDARFGWMSEQWLAEHRASHAP